jgi:hypothetical protein
MVLLDTGYGHAKLHTGITECAISSGVTGQISPWSIGHLLSSPAK